MPELQLSSHQYLYIFQKGCGCRLKVISDCGDPLCVDCEKKRSRERKEKWGPVLDEMHKPTMLTFTIKDGPDLKERIICFQESFRRLLDKRLGPVNLPVLCDEAEKFIKGYLEGKGFSPAEISQKNEGWIDEIEKFRARLSKSYEPVRFRDLLGYGFASLEITYGDKLGAGKNDWHVHRHLCLDMRFIPWPILVVGWMEATKGEGFIVDVRRISKDKFGLAEVVKYLTKSWEIKEENKRDEFREAVKGIKRVWPIGGAKPAKVQHVCPACHKEDCKGSLIGYLYNLKTWQAEDGKTYSVAIKDDCFKPFEGLVFFAQNEEGLETGIDPEQLPEGVYLILRDLACQVLEGPPKGNPKVRPKPPDFYHLGSLVS